jgi:hypothetical protein
MKFENGIPPIILDLATVPSGRRLYLFGPDFEETRALGESNHGNSAAYGGANREVGRHGRTRLFRKLAPIFRDDFQILIAHHSQQCNGGG